MDMTGQNAAKQHMKYDDFLSFPVIRGDDMDEVVRLGVNNILQNGERIAVRAGEGLQAYGVTYVLNNPNDRLHLHRPGAVRYLCREFLAYFKGSLQVDDGLSQASSFWTTLKDKSGAINSNYGYYTFYEPVPDYGNQYNWVVRRLSENNDSRRAIININQTYHKSETLDFPCTVGVQFYMRDSHLVAEIYARSTDSCTGLPFDLGYFSFLHELIWRDLVERGLFDLKLGPTLLRATFTQIYDRTADKALSCLEKSSHNSSPRMIMPPITSAKATLQDILNGTTETELMKWIVRHAE